MATKQPSITGNHSKIGAKLQYHHTQKFKFTFASQFPGILCPTKTIKSNILLSAASRTSWKCFIKSAAENLIVLLSAACPLYIWVNPFRRRNDSLFHAVSVNSVSVSIHNISVNNKRTNAFSSL